MKTHLIIGRGNVGVDLQEVIKASGETARIFTRSDGFDFPESFPAMQIMKPDYIWVPAGAGSVEAAKTNFQNVIDTHVMLPHSIIEEFRKEPVRIVLFSSDYAANETDASNPSLQCTEPRSLYALSKIMMENMVKLQGRGNVAVVRIGTVYGAHFHEKTFPGKLRVRYPTACQLELPMNRVVPTSSKWIAETLMANRDKLFNSELPTIHHLAPLGGISIKEWGHKILGEEFTIKSKGFDQERPLCSNLGCSFAKAPDWTDLWSSNWYTKPSTPDLL